MLRWQAQQTRLSAAFVRPEHTGLGLVSECGWAPVGVVRLIGLLHFRESRLSRVLCLKRMEFLVFYYIRVRYELPFEL